MRYLTALFEPLQLLSWEVTNANKLTAGFKVERTTQKNHKDHWLGLGSLLGFRMT